MQLWCNETNTHFEEDSMSANPQQRQPMPIDAASVLENWIGLGLESAHHASKREGFIYLVYGIEYMVLW